MSDHQPLHDAFAEYERRADAVGAARSSAPPAAHTSRGPMLLIAASVVLVLAVAGGVAWLAVGVGTTSGSGQPALGRPYASPTSTGLPQAATSVPTALPASSRSSRHVNGPAVPLTSPAPTSTPTGGAGVPKNAKQMQRAFARVLGDTATFTVDQHQGNYLVGILTATSSGSKGGFDIQASNGKAGDKAFCEDPGKGSHCTISKPTGGGSLAVERETSGGGRGVLFFVDYVFPDGSTYLMHLSNLADPKGAGQSYGPKPPLTLAQLTTIVESPAWSDQ